MAQHVWLSGAAFRCGQVQVRAPACMPARSAPLVRMTLTACHHPYCDDGRPLLRGLTYLLLGGREMRVRQLHAAGVYVGGALPHAGGRLRRKDATPHEIRDPAPSACTVARHCS